MAKSEFKTVPSTLAFYNGATEVNEPVPVTAHQIYNLEGDSTVYPFVTITLPRSEKYSWQESGYNQNGVTLALYTPELDMRLVMWPGAMKFFGNYLKFDDSGNKPMDVDGLAVIWEFNQFGEFEFETEIETGNDTYVRVHGWVQPAILDVPWLEYNNCGEIMDYYVKDALLYIAENIEVAPETPINQDVYDNHQVLYTSYDAVGIQDMVYIPLHSGTEIYELHTFYKESGTTIRLYLPGNRPDKPDLTMSMTVYECMGEALDDVLEEWAEIQETYDDYSYLHPIDGYENLYRWGRIDSEYSTYCYIKDNRVIKFEESGSNILTLEELLQYIELL